MRGGERGRAGDGSRRFVDLRSEPGTDPPRPRPLAARPRPQEEPRAGKETDGAGGGAGGTDDPARKLQKIVRNGIVVLVRFKSYP